MYYMSISALVKGQLSSRTMGLKPLNPRAPGIEFGFGSQSWVSTSQAALPVLKVLASRV